MCLLKPNERINNCAHEECKHIQMLNKNACLHNLNQSSKPNNLQNTNNLAQLLQNQSFGGFQPQQSPGLTGIQGIQQYNFSKNIITRSPNEDFDDEDSFMLNKKKVKVDTANNSTNEPKQFNQNKEFQPNTILINPNYQQQYTMNNNNNEDNKMIFNNPNLNNILMNNNQNQTEVKPNNYQVINMNGQTMYIPIMQNSQQQMVDNNNNNNNMNQQNIQYVQYQPNFQPAYQNFSQNMKIKPSVVSETSSFSNQSENIVNNRESSSPKLEDFMKDVQNKLVELMCSQNKMLIDLREKNDLVQDTLACLINEVSALKQIVKQQNNPEKKVADIQKPTLVAQLPENSRETATAESLLNTLYGPQHEFQYQLVFKTELALPLYRERNFKFTVLLTDKEGNVIKNSNRIPLTLAIYTSENPPKFVDVNTAGNKVLKGMIDKDMVDGAVTFDKIQIKEVTSHFRNGWVFFVVYPKATGVVLNNYVAAANGVMVNATQIKPLVLEKVVVKAKRTKEKETIAEFEDNQSSDVEL